MGMWYALTINKCSQSFRHIHADMTNVHVCCHVIFVPGSHDFHDSGQGQWCGIADNETSHSHFQVRPFVLIFKASSTYNFFIGGSSLFSLLRSTDDVLTPEDYKQLFQFVYSSQRPLASNAGELVFSRYLKVNCLKQSKKQMMCVFTN